MKDIYVTTIKNVLLNLYQVVNLGKVVNSSVALETKIFEVPNIDRDVNTTDMSDIVADVRAKNNVLTIVSMAT